MRKIHLKTVNKHKVVFIIIMAILFKSNLYCQKLDSLKKTDTIYIYFDINKKNSIKDKSFINEQSEFYKNYIMYRFNPSHLNTISFTSNTYKDTDNMINNIKNDEFTTKKSFLKKNKEVILDIDFFEENGFIKTFDVLYTKVIYLIDKDEIKGKKIKVKQVDIRCSTCHGE